MRELINNVSFTLLRNGSIGEEAIQCFTAALAPRQWLCKNIVAPNFFFVFVVKAVTIVTKDSSALLK